MYKRVFIAEDDEDDFLLFRDALQEYASELKITRAVDGIELLEQLEDAGRPPDIIFMDINMPRMNGIECLRELRSRPGFDNVPVVVMSTTISPEMQKQLKKSKDLFFSKPNSYTDFRNRLHELVTHYVLGNDTA